MIVFIHLFVPVVVMGEHLLDGQMLTDTDIMVVVVMVVCLQLIKRHFNKAFLDLCMAFIFQVYHNEQQIHMVMGLR